jgi:hypothetical protein
MTRSRSIEWLPPFYSLALTAAAATDTAGPRDTDDWAAFKQTGHWPDRTIFVMENRGAATKGSINKRGHFQTTEFMGLEFHVRDDARFKGGWEFFASDGTKPAALLLSSDSCHACHAAHGALDTTFTQCYPTAKEIALAKHSLLEDR